MDNRRVVQVRRERVRALHAVCSVGMKDLSNLCNVILMTVSSGFLGFLRFPSGALCVMCEDIIGAVRTRGVSERVTARDLCMSGLLRRNIQFNSIHGSHNPFHSQTNIFHSYITARVPHSKRLLDPSCTATASSLTHSGILWRYRQHGVTQAC